MDRLTASLANTPDFEPTHDPHFATASRRIYKPIAVRLAKCLPGAHASHKKGISRLWSRALADRPNRSSWKAQRNTNGAQALAQPKRSVRLGAARPGTSFIKKRHDHEGG
jgi:hypothetical protein